MNTLQPEETLSYADALSLGVIDEVQGLGFVNPTTAFKNVNRQIMEHVKAGNLVWRKPWRDGYRINGETVGPQNYESRQPYKGFNAWLISFININIGENNEHFLTEKQIKERGGKLKKGAVKYPVSAFVKGTKTTKLKNGKEIDEEYAGWMHYNVYPIGHTTGVKPVKRRTESEIEITVPDAETLIAGMPKLPPIKNGGNEAFYSPGKDFVQMPVRKAFKKQPQYYAVLFHELIHSTGHKKRVGRDLSGTFGTKQYAFEELIAELGAAYLCGVTELPYHNLHNTAAYLKNWASRLEVEIKKDETFLFRAVYAASKAARYIIADTLEKSAATPVAPAKQTEADKGAEVKPNKKVKTSVSAAIADLVEHSKAFRGYSPMALSMLYSAAKNDNFNAWPDTLKGKMFEKLEEWGLIESELHGQADYILLPAGQELIDKINARIETLKGKKAGTDLFPELAGVDEEPGCAFLKGYLALHGRTIGVLEIESLIDPLHHAVKAKQIQKPHPLRTTINKAQAKLVRLVNRLQPGERVPVAIGNRRSIRAAMEKKMGLGFLNVVAAAAAGKMVEHLVHKKLSKPALSGIDEPAQVTPEAPAQVGFTATSKKTATVVIPKQEPVIGEQTDPGTEPEAEIKPVNRFGFVRADQAAEVKAPGTFRLKGELGKFLGDMQPYKYSIVLTGDPHAGKTEFSSQLADAFAEIGKDVAVISVEQGGMESKDTRGAIDRNVKPANKARVHVTGELANGLATLKEIATEFPVVIVDSWQKLGIPSTMFDRLRHEHPNTIWIVIFQQNGSGGTRGGVAADYDTPVLLRVHKVDSTFVNNYVELKKNRGNPLNWKYMVKSKKTVPV